MRKLTLGLFAGIILISVLALAWIARYLIYASPGEMDSGQSLNSVQWLPQEASNISYSKTAYFNAFEFTISQEGFLDWVKDKKYGAPVSITKPVTVSRYFTILKIKPLGEDNNKVEVTAGMIIDNRIDGGGGRLIVYDQKAHKAFYLWTRL